VHWETFLGYLTGLRFATADIDLTTLLRTALIVNICNAIVCRVIAGNHGMARTLWTALGFVFGFWALAAALTISATRTLGNDEGGR
jgi:hypothetical protein